MWRPLSFPGEISTMTEAISALSVLGYSIFWPPIVVEPFITAVTLTSCSAPTGTVVSTKIMIKRTDKTLFIVIPPNNERFRVMLLPSVNTMPIATCGQRFQPDSRLVDCIQKRHRRLLEYVLP